MSQATLSGIPVFMYHSVTNRVDFPESINPIHIGAADFGAQMQHLADRGYQSITIGELMQRRAGNDCARKEFVLTFDDGYESLLTVVTPILQKHNFTATLFLTTAAVGADSYEVLSHFETSYPTDDRPLTWAELREMKSKGWDIEAHGHRHLVHNAISAEALLEEMKHCIEAIQKNLEYSPSYYSYPYGRYNTACLETIKKLGLAGAFSVHPGLTKTRSPQGRMPRAEINRMVNLRTFQELLLTGYESPKKKLRSQATGILYSNTRLKDFLKTSYNLFRKY